MRATRAEADARRAEAHAIAERNAANLARDAEAVARKNAEVQRLQAEANFKKAREAVDEYFTKVSESKLLNVPGLQPLRKDLLESARKYYDQFLRDRGKDTSVRAEAAEAWYRLGFVASQVGTPIEAAKSLQEAVVMYEGLARDHPAEARYFYKLAMALNDLGNRQYSLGRIAEALRTQERSLEIRRRVAAENPSVPEYQKELGIGLMNCGSRKRSAGQVAEATLLFEEARDLYQRLIREYPDVADYRYRLSGAYLDIGNVHEDSGRTDKAFQAAGKAWELLEGIVRDHPDEMPFRLELAWTSRWIGQIYHRRTDRRAEAIPYYRRAIDLLEQLARENPEVRTYPLQLAYGYCYLGQVLHMSGQEPEASDVSRKALALFERIDREGKADLYDLACIRSLSSDLIKLDGSGKEAGAIAKPRGSGGGGIAAGHRGWLPRPRLDRERHGPGSLAVARRLQAAHQAAHGRRDESKEKRATSRTCKLMGVVLTCGSRLAVSRLPTAHGSTRPSQFAGWRGDFSYFAATSAISGCWSGQRRGDSPLCARSSPRSERLADAMTPRIPQDSAHRARPGVRRIAQSLAAGREETAEQAAGAQFLQPRLPGLCTGADPLGDLGHFPRSRRLPARNIRPV